MAPVTYTLWEMQLASNVHFLNVLSERSVCKSQVPQKLGDGRFFHDPSGREGALGMQMAAERLHELIVTTISFWFLIV